MDNTKFKVGDRVIITKSYQGLNKGHTGVIVTLKIRSVGIEVDNWNKGHSCEMLDNSISRYWVDYGYFKINKITNWKGEFQ